ncbi:MAG TPA: M20/M25/M40 family metallo-hydrolase [Solirubrobacteraceae bacterium]|nr:M20/M25/M40 family metallo-hydrolase [Solirubrobacteraceae bacterium]
MSDRLRRDVVALAAMQRDSAGVGERGAANWIAGRLRDGGLADVAIQPFRYQRTYAGAHAAHAAAGLAAAALPGPAGRALALAGLASLELEGSGRRQWLRALLPKGEGANVVARVPAAGVARETIVVVAHHDAARTGLFWHPRLARLSAARNARRRAIDGYLQPAAAGFALAALPWRATRAGGAVLLAAALAAAADIARSPTVPGASDNATGVAALLALAAELGAEPLPGADVVLLSAGCEESGMGGMAAFLARHALDPARTFVIGLDTLGAGTPIQLRGEGVILTHRYAERDLDRVDAAARAAGLAPPPRWRLGGWTDPILARFAGLPAVSLLSMGDGHIPEYHRRTDTPERVDWDCVDACLALARAILRTAAGASPGTR